MIPKYFVWLVVGISLPNGAVTQGPPIPTSVIASTTTPPIQFLQNFSLGWTEDGNRAIVRDEFGNVSQIPELRLCTMAFDFDVENYDEIITRDAAMYETYWMFFHIMDNLGGLFVNGQRYQPSLTILRVEPNDDFIRNQAAVMVQHLNCKFFLAPPFERAAEILAGMANDHGLLMVSPMNWGNAVFAYPNNVFGMHPPPDKILPPSLRLAADSGLVGKVAVVWENVSHSEAVCSNVHAWAQGEQLEVVLSMSSNSLHDTGSDPALWNITQALRDAQADLLVLCVHDSSGCNMIERLYGLDVNPAVIIVAGCMAVDSYMGYLGFHGRYILGADVWAASLKETSNLALPGISTHRFVEGYRSIHPGRNPSLSHAMAWMTLDLLFWAMQKAESVTDTQKVATWIRSASNRSSIGVKFHFNSNGLNDAEGITMQYQGQSNISGDRIPDDPDHFNLEELPEVVAPPLYATEFAWLPKPTWDHLQCYRSDTMGGTFGFFDVTDTNAQCQSCLKGQLSSTEFEVLASRPQFGRIAVRVCHDCATGKFLREVTGSSTSQELGIASHMCGDCDIGRYAGSSGATACASCSKGYYQDTRGKSSCIACPTGRYQDRSGRTACHTCQDAQIAVFNGTVTCKGCPRGALCNPDENNLYSSYTNKDGWFLMTPEEYDQEKWVEHNVGDEFPLGKPFLCIFEANVCRSNRVCMTHGNSESMSGPMCGICADNYMKTRANGVCHKCPPLVLQALYTLLNFLGFAGLGVFCLVDSISSDSTGVNQIYSILIKLLINYSALVYAVRPFVTFKIFGVTIWDYMYWTHHLGSTSPSMIETSASCFLRNLFGGEISYSFTYLGFFMIPIWIVVNIVMFFLTKGIYRLITKQSLTYNANIRNIDGIVCLICCQLHINLVRITRMFEGPLRCTTFDVNRYLFNTSIKCTDSRHRHHQVLAIIGISSICIFVPVLMFATLHQYASDGRLDNPKVRRRYGFFYTGFKPEYWYFELVHMLRKVCFIVVPVLPIFASETSTNRGKASQTVLLVLTIVFMFIHFNVRPYDARHYSTLNRVEGFMLITVFVTVVAQLLSSSTDNADVYVDHLTGEPYQSSRDLRDAFLFFIVLICHLSLLVFVTWCFLRNTILELEWFKKHRSVAGRTTVSINRRGCSVTGLRQSALNLLCTINMNIGSVYLLNSPVFNFYNYAMLLQRVTTDAAYRTGLQTRHGRMRSEIMHRFRSMVLHGDFHLFDDSHDVLSKIRSDLVQSFDVGGISGAIDKALEDMEKPGKDADDDFMAKESHTIRVAGVPYNQSSVAAHHAMSTHPNVEKYIDMEEVRQVRLMILKEMTSLDSYDGKDIEVEMIFEAHIRCSRDLTMACRAFHDEEDIRKQALDGMEEASRRGETMQHILRSVTQVHAEDAVQNGRSDRDVLDEEYLSEKFTEMAELQEETTNHKVDQIEDLVDSVLRLDETRHRVNGLPLDIDRMHAAELRRLKRNANATSREVELLSSDIASFIRREHRRYNGRDDRSLLPRARLSTASIASADDITHNLLVTIIEASHLRDHSMYTSGEFNQMRCIVTCYIHGRPLLDLDAQFRTPPQHPIHPHWNFEGKLKNFRHHETIEFELRDIHKQSLIGRARLEGSKLYRVDDKGKQRFGFDGECPVDLQGNFNSETHANASLAKISVSIRLETEDSDSDDENSKERDDDNSKELPILTNPSMLSRSDIESTTGALKEYSMQSVASNARGLSAIDHMKEQIADLKLQIADAQREAEEAAKSAPLQKGLLTLSSLISFTGDREPFLEVGKSIFGAFQAATEAQKQCRNVAVQTDPAVFEAVDEEERARAAELLQLKFKQKEYDLQIATCTQEIEKLGKQLDSQTSARGDSLA